VVLLVYTVCAQAQFTAVGGNAWGAHQQMGNAATRGTPPETPILKTLLLTWLDVVMLQGDGV
jgi:hypothetical protein